MLNLYTELAARIEAVMGANATPVGWIDLWNNQVAKYEGELPFAMPAILIQMEIPEWQTVGGGIQKGSVSLHFHVLMQDEEDSYNGSSNQTGALAHLGWLDALHACLQGWAGSNFSSLDRTGQMPDEDHGDGITHDVMSYQTTYTDETAVPVTTASTITQAAPTAFVNTPDDRPAAPASPYGTIAVG